MIRKLNGYLRRIPVWAVWLFGLVPLALLIWDTLMGGLGVDPIADLEHRLGRTALYFLIAGLAVTPLLRLGRLNLMRFRRALGLLAFSYAVLHVLVWVVLDMGLSWGQMLGDLVKRPYLTVGMLAALALVPLAVTSNNWSIRKLGGAEWRRLHQLVYIAVPAAAMHFLWVGKVAKPEPILWLGVAVALLLVRL
ncbi:protein-methionine-sulfoxide reductase heme-binding subunit MsrQ [Paracoccus aminophilus]|nr:protein-methionine-sulfoxide reductase heme-binding subunit MsrQ [Paracoccus aminophilus]